METTKLDSSKCPSSGENNCGYVQRIKNTPNLFQYATSELSQDAFLCWLFEHVQLHSDDIAYHIAKELLEIIKANYIKLYPEISLEMLDEYYLTNIDQQIENIDILLTLTSLKYDEKVYIVIEDKINSGESRKNQLEHYSKKLKIKDPKAIIIPVLFKTGYVSAKLQKKYEARKIVFIGYREIYNLFSAHLHLLQENIILQSWWETFYERYYRPIKVAKSLQIDPESTLKHFNHLSREQSFPEELSFKKMTGYLFSDIDDNDLQMKHYNVQGKGHTDWHYELKKSSWRNNNGKINLTIYLIWDRHKYSFVIKTAPIPYKPQRRLTDTEKKKYLEAQEFIKSEIRNKKLTGWKVTNYYLTIAQMKNINDTPIGMLKEQIMQDIKLLTGKFDQLMQEWA